MSGRKHSYCIYLDERERKELRHLSMSHTSPHAEVVRARVLLLSNEHPEWTSEQIAEQAGCQRPTVTSFATVGFSREASRTIPGRALPGSTRRA
jgi:hypothetical protein